MQGVELGPDNRAQTSGPPSSRRSLTLGVIANLQKMAVAESREVEPTTGRRNELGLAVRQATIELLADNCRQ